MKRIILSAFTVLFFITFSQAQCSSGELEVTLEISTDNWGYESYWEIVPFGNPCGTGTLYSGGNSGQVGCGGGGQQTASAGNGYGNNTIINEGPWCLSEGTFYDIYLVDDYGDGGTEVIVKVNGFEMETFTSSGSSSFFTFEVAEPALLDLSVHHNLVFDYTVKGLVDIQAEFMNEGQNAITSFDFNYSIDGGTTQTQSFTALNITTGEEVEFLHNTPWDATSIGTFDVEIWVSNVNGQVTDEDPSNDNLPKQVTISNPQPRILHSYVTEPYTIEEIANSGNQVSHPRDLDFHPDFSRKELWVINMGTENSGGSTVTINNAGEAGQTEQYVQDGNAWHFMSLPTAMAFGENGNWANSTGVLDANHNGGTFTGPALWSSDLSIYGVIGNPPTAAFNGSHLDMLHGSPFCMGIAHLESNTYFVFDAYNNEIVKYAFEGDHGPGKDDHDNGEIYRYSEIFVERNGVEIPNHMVINKENGELYFTDHKNSKVIRMDVNSGTIGNNLPLVNEQLSVHVDMTGVDFGDFIVTGITTPCGIDVLGDRLIVGDYDNGDILLYDISTSTPILMTTIVTGATGLMGIKIGPEGRIWYVDAEANTVNKINVVAVVDTNNVGITDLKLAGLISVYPNPTSDIITIDLPDYTYDDFEINLYDMIGTRLAGYSKFEGRSLKVNMAKYTSGTYLLEVKTSEGRATKQIIKK